MSVRLYGDWSKARSIFGSLASRFQHEIKKASGIVTEYIDRVVTLHLDRQDLNWKPLSPEFLKFKRGHGYSTDIYTMTASYRNSIATWVSPDGFSCAVGVKRTALHAKSKRPLVQLGYVLEYGSEAAGIPARPLWRPSFDETKPEILEIYKKAIMRCFT